MMCKLKALKAKCGAIFANTWSDELKNAADNVYTRSLFGSD